jgi:hypothetical protein
MLNNLIQNVFLKQFSEQTNIIFFLNLSKILKKIQSNTKNKKELCAFLT